MEVMGRIPARELPNHPSSEDIKEAITRKYLIVPLEVKAIYQEPDYLAYAVLFEDGRESNGS